MSLQIIDEMNIAGSWSFLARAKILPADTSPDTLRKFPIFNCQQRPEWFRDAATIPPQPENAVHKREL